MAHLIVLSDLAAPAMIGRGGHATYVLHWLHGLERFGHRVLFLEYLAEHPGDATHAVIDHFRATMADGWHPDQSALLLDDPVRSLAGLDVDEVSRWAAEAAAVITLAAPYRRDPYPLIDRIRPRVLIDTDPAYTHLWAAEGDDPADIFGEHDLYYTVGGNVGTPRCGVPTLGLDWRPIWNPVVLDWWAADRPLARDRFTTVADWRGFGYLEYAGQVLGPKSREFNRFIELPRLAGEEIELTLTIDAADPSVETLRAAGWRLESPEVVSTPARYRDYVAGSLGEFSCAKGGYAGTRCGWFSDRSACYLAAGRPVVLQSTGFEDLLPTGRGLFAVADPAEAAEALRAVRRDYATHSAAARALAREHFDSDRILARLLADAGVGKSVVLSTR